MLADRILVLEGGRAVQEGTPAAVARRPATEYVARLVGLNLYRGGLADRVPARVDLDDGGQLFAAGRDPDDGGADVVPPLPRPAMLVAVAPTAISLARRPPAPASARNVWPAPSPASSCSPTGCGSPSTAPRPALVDITPAALADLGLHTGQRSGSSAKATEVIGVPVTGHEAGAAHGLRHPRGRPGTTARKAAEVAHTVSRESAVKVPSRQWDAFVVDLDRL